MRTMKKQPQGRPQRAPTTTLVLALLAVVLLAGPALAAGHEGLGKSATPGRPTAKSPHGTIDTTRPFFKWSKVSGVTKYELRLYQGSQLLVTVTVETQMRNPATRLSGEMPAYVTLKWKVRAINAGGNGPWSKTLKFKVVPG